MKYTSREWIIKHAPCDCNKVWGQLTREPTVEGEEGGGEGAETQEEEGWGARLSWCGSSLLTLVIVRAGCPIIDAKTGSNPSA